MERQQRRHRFICAAISSVSALTVLAAGQAFGQAPAAKAALKDKNAVEEIIVTANRREQNLQSVGGALQVITGLSLEKNGAAKLGDFLLEIPGISYRDLGNGANDISLRGVSNIAADESGTNRSVSTVGLYFGDVPIQGTSVFPDTAFYDLARVEVLKGPQGTLYGEGAVGGAIRLIPHPVDFGSFNGNAEITGSTPSKGDPGYQARGAVNVPLIGDTLALRVVGGYRQVGGFIDNVATGQKNFNTQDGYNIRATLRAAISDRFEVEVLGLKSQDNSYGFNQVNSNLGPLQSDSTESRANLQGFQLGALTLSYDLGFAKASFVGAYSGLDRTFQEAYPLAKSLFKSFGVAIQAEPEHFFVPQQTRTQELRVVSQGSNSFEYVFGVFHRTRDSKSFISLDFLPGDLAAVNAVFAAVKFPPFPDRKWVISQINTTSEQYAVYGEGTYHLTPTIDLTAGLRWFKEDNTFWSQSIGYSILASVTNINAATPTSTSDVIPKVNITWRPSENYTLYGQVAEGFRSGGVNFEYKIIPGSKPGYDPDGLWNYEIGARAQLLDNRLNVKASAFHIDWTDLQLAYSLPNVIGGVTSTVQNGGKATIDGFESEVSWRIADGLSTGGSVAFTDAQLTSAPAGSKIVGKQKLPNVPKVTGALFAEYRHPLTPSYDGVVHFDLEHTSNQNEQLVTNDGIDGYPVKGYELANIRVGIESDRWSATLFVKNIGDTRAQLGRGLTYATASVRENWFTISQPRTVGITLRTLF